MNEEARACRRWRPLRSKERATRRRSVTVWGWGCSYSLALSLSLSWPMPAPLAHSAVDTPSEPVHCQWLSCPPSWSKRPQQESH